MESAPINELFKDLERYVGVFNIEDRAAEFIKGFRMMHRTNQQSFFRLMLKVIEHMASDEYPTDLRNQDSKKVAKELLVGFTKVNEVAGLYDDPRCKLPSFHLGTV